MHPGKEVEQKGARRAPIREFNIKTAAIFLIPDSETVSFSASHCMKNNIFIHVCNVLQDNKSQKMLGFENNSS